MLHHTLEYLLTAHPQYASVREFKKRAVEYRRMAGKYKRNFGKAEREQRRMLYQEAKELSREAIDMEDHLINTVLNWAQVVTCTLVGANNRYLRGRFYEVAVIDEAAQGLEPACWIPIAKAEKVVFAGDPFQLPPTLFSKEAEKAGLNQTLIEKCMERLPQTMLLDTQYRMNGQIMGFSNQLFYNNELKAHDSVAGWTLPLTDGMERPIEFIDTAGCGFDEKQHESSRSLYNEDEFNVLTQHFQGLMDALSGKKISVGVISPYRAQVNYMREATEGDEEWAKADINTIDSFQGQERDVIYISLVRSNEKAEIGFLADYRRMNVAMTRARKKLIIIGDSATLGNHDFYRQFLEYVENAGGYRSAWEWMG